MIEKHGQKFLLSDLNLTNTSVNQQVQIKIQKLIQKLKAPNQQEALTNILYFPKSNFTVQSTAISSFANSKTSTKRFTKSRSTSKKKSSGVLKIVDQSEQTKGDWYGL